MHVDEDKVNNVTFAPQLQKAGYTVGMFGKYLNNCPGNPPPGWDVWLANGGGDYYNPNFAVKNVDGVPDSGGREVGGFPLGSNYTTSVVGNYSVRWIEKVAGTGRPFFAYIAPKAAHEPFQPAPWYKNAWSAHWPTAAPRPPSWNLTAAQLANHHPNVASQAVLTNKVADCIDAAFKDRWRTLMSVDDVIGAVYALNKRIGVHNSTFYIYSSDHGFQLGELNLPQDKRNVYEFDVKIHMVMTGPGIAQGSTWDGPATNVDFFPTFLALAGLPATEVDGMSFASQVAPSFPVGAEDAGGWRDGIYIHHQRVGAGSYCGPGHFIDQMDNNFIAVRHFNNSRFGNLLYAEFQWANGTNFGMGSVDFQCTFFTELFDMDLDPWQMHNIYADTKASDPSKVKALHDDVQAWLRCKGASCKPSGHADAVDGRQATLWPPAAVPPACVPVPRPSPPPPPPPPPPVPVPRGSRIFVHGGLCLTANGGKPATMNACASKPPKYNEEQVWDDQKIGGHPCIRSLSSKHRSDGCLNIADGSKACSMQVSQTFAHLFQCPGGAGNRLVWNESASVIHWVDGHGSPLACGPGTEPRCLVVVNGSSVEPVIRVDSCAADGARGWTRIST